jgi:hypothetical protein
MPLLATAGIASISSFGNRSGVVGGSTSWTTSTQGLRVPASANFAYTGNFTIEAWVYPTVVTGSFSGANIIWAQTASRPSYFLIFLDGNGALTFQFNGTVKGTTGNVATLNAWNHVAVVRNGTTVTLYLNGVGSGASTVSGTIATGSYAPTIGHYTHNENVNTFRGYITNTRCATSAIYTANFTPSKTPFTNTSQGATTTQLLLNHQTSSRFLTDSGPNTLTVTNIDSTLSYNTLSPYTVPYVTPPTVTILSAVITPSTVSVNEGTAVTFTIAGTNTANGTYYWSVEQAEGTGSVTAGDFTGGALNGSFTITSNSGSVVLTASADLTTEGAELFNLFVRTGSATGPSIGVSPDITINDTSITPPTLTSDISTVNEGSTVTFTASNVGADGTYYWTINNVSTANADFPGVSGSFTVSGHTGNIDNGTGTFTITPTKDLLTEGSETFTVSVRSVSISGTVIVTSGTITIADTSLTPTVTSAASVNEGSAITFTASNLGPDGTYYWTILNGTSANADFSAVSGSFTIAGHTGNIDNGTGTFSVTPLADSLTEGAETFQVQVRSVSISGTVIVTSSAVTINDTSLTPQVNLFSTSGPGSMTTPAGYTFVTVEAIGGGGQGFGTSTSSSQAGGGGGSYAKTALIAVTPGTTIYYQVGQAAVDSWVNVSSASAPTSTVQGCLAKPGDGAGSGGPGQGGPTATSIGGTKFAGGNGGSGASAAGGGGAGDSLAGGNAVGAAFGAGGTGTNLTGGNGGSFGFVGNAPGGGGGSSTTVNSAGGVGRVRIVFTS